MRAVPSHAGRPTERGQAIVEFALVTPVLLLILVVVVHFAMAMYLQQTLNNAAYEGARVWAKSPAGDQFQCILPCGNYEQDFFNRIVSARVKQMVKDNGFNGEISQITGQSTTDAVTVTIYYPYGPALGNLFKMKLRASCTFKKG